MPVVALHRVKGGSNYDSLNGQNSAHQCGYEVRQVLCVGVGDGTFRLYLSVLARSVSSVIKIAETNWWEKAKVYFFLSKY